MCLDLSQLAAYASFDNARFRLMKAAAPGPYTFILRGTREVPRRLLHPRRRTIGARIPAHAIARALLAELGEPMLSATLQLPGGASPLADAPAIRAALEHALDLVVDGGACGTQPSTVVDLTGDAAIVVRAGKGALDVFGTAAAL